MFNLFRSSRRNESRYRPRLESLEDRFAPAAFLVDRLGDAGDGQGGVGDLRYVMTQLSLSNDAENSIDFLEELAGTIGLQTPLPAIDRNVVINGLGEGVLEVSRVGVNPFRIFTINQGKTVTIAGLKLSNGRMPLEDGGGISNSGRLTLQNVTVTGNYAGWGGGIASYGHLVLSACTVSSNTAMYGGGVYVNIKLFGNPPNVNGAQFNDGTRIIGNTAHQTNELWPQGGDGGGIYVFRGQCRANEGTEIRGNRAARGGGIFNDALGNLSLVQTTISANIPLSPPPNSLNIVGYGGGIYNRSTEWLAIHGCTISDHDWSADTVQGIGAGIYQESGGISIGTTNISNNRASDNGGGLYVFRGIFDAERVRFDNNAARSGGAAYVGDVVILDNCRGAGNRSRDGGFVIHGAPGGRIVLRNNTNITMNAGDAPNLAAIQIDGADLVMDQTTISTNQGIGVRLNGGTASIATSTISSNTEEGIVGFSGTLALEDNTAENNGTADILFAGAAGTLTGLLGRAGDVKQTAGDVDLNGKLAITELFKLEGGTFDGFTESTLNAQKVWQTAGLLSFSSGSSLDVATDLLVDGGTATLDGLLDVAGIYKQTGGTAFMGADAVAISGQAIISGGTLNLHGPVTVALGMEILSGGTLQVTTDGAVNGSVINSGTINIGALNHAPETLVISGGFTQTSGGILRLQLGVTSDHVNIGGHASLAGTLEVGVEDGYSPSGGSFTPISWGSASGEFDIIYLPALPEPEFWIVDYGAFGLDLFAVV